MKKKHRQHGNGDKGAYNDDDQPFDMWNMFHNCIPFFNS
jgi:hypothetical protein